MSDFKYLAGAVSIMDNVSRYLVLCDEIVSKGDIVKFHCEEGEVYARVTYVDLVTTDSYTYNLAVFLYGEQPLLCEEHFRRSWEAGHGSI